MSARNEPHWGEISLLNWVSPVLWNKAKTNQPQNDHSTPNSHRAHQLHSLLLVGVASSPVKLPAGQGKPRLHPLMHRADLKRCVLKLPGPCGGGGGRGDTLGGAPSASCPPGPLGWEARMLVELSGAQPSSMQLLHGTGQRARWEPSPLPWWGLSCQKWFHPGPWFKLESGKIQRATAAFVGCYQAGIHLHFPLSGVSVAPLAALEVEVSILHQVLIKNWALPIPNPARLRSLAEIVASLTPHQSCVKHARRPAVGRCPSGIQPWHGSTS